MKVINILKLGFLIVAVLAFGGSSIFLAGWFQDEQALREAVSGRFISKPGSGIFIEEVTGWVFQNQGFRKNRGYFLFKSLGPTPKQVLDGGGDCADKSRLLSTILRLFGVESTLVTLYACAECGPTHVVVEARYDRGWMVADPVFDMVFPSDELSYYGVSDLKSDPSLLINRLDHLTQVRGYRHPVRVYRRSTETYGWARYINWTKLPWSKNFASVLARFDLDLHQFRRPYFLEDPKLLLSVMSGLAGIGAAMLWVIIRFWASRLTENQPAGPLTGRRAIGSPKHCR